MGVFFYLLAMSTDSNFHNVILPMVQQVVAHALCASLQSHGVLIANGGGMYVTGDSSNQFIWSNCNFSYNSGVLPRSFAIGH